MKITLTTPALLFSAISLLLLAYTNRFLTIATLIRNLYAKYKEQPDKIILGQISNLRKRTYLIRNMQLLGLCSLLLCVLCMFLVYIEKMTIAEWVFGISLVLLILSLSLSMREIQISVKALDLQLSDMESETDKNTTI